MALKVGELLTIETVNYIKAYTDSDDYAKVSDLNNLNKENILAILRRDKPIREGTRKITTDLLQIAIKKRDGSYKELNKTHRKLLKEIE